MKETPQNTKCHHLPEDGLWYAETPSGVGAYRADLDDAMAAAWENERQALILDEQPDRGKRHPPPPMTQVELDLLVACGLARPLVKCGERTVYELTPEGRVLFEHSLRVCETMR